MSTKDRGNRLVDVVFGLSQNQKQALDQLVRKTGRSRASLLREAVLGLLSKGPDHSCGPESPWRIATVFNPRTQRANRVQVNKDGSLPPSQARRSGVPHASEWDAVHARSWRAAIRKIEVGLAIRYERQNGTVRPAH